LHTSLVSVFIFYRYEYCYKTNFFQGKNKIFQVELAKINDSNQVHYYSVGTKVLLQGSSVQGVKLTTHFLIVVRLKMTGSLLLLPIHTFMACWLESWLLLVVLVVVAAVVLVKIQVLQDMQPCWLVSIYQHLPFETCDHLSLSMR